MIQAAKNFRNAAPKWLGDIRFWILLFFVLRLYGITDAPLETWHNWRQSLTNMIARNFLQIDPNIMYPRIDMDGSHTGIIGSEFPFFNYLIFLIAKVFGYAHWYGRLINLLVSSIGIYYFYLILRRFFNEQHAFYSSIVLLCSLWFSFSRKSMPDTFCMAWIIIGIYHAFRFVYDHRNSSLIWFLLFASLGILCKIPAMFLLCVLGIPLMDQQVDWARKSLMVVGSLLVLAIAGLWYFYWVPHLLSTFGFQLYFPKGIVEGVKEWFSFWPEGLEKFYFSSLESFIGFLLFVWGLIGLFRKGEKILLFIFFSCLGVFLLFTFKTGAVFPKHNYYVIPFVPVMALVAGYGIVLIRKRSQQMVIVFFLVMEALLNQQHDFRIKPEQRYKLGLENIAGKYGNRSELVVINGGLSPQLMYFVNRRGWSMSNEEITRPGKLAELRKEGARWLFIDKNEGAIGPIDPSAKQVYVDKDFIVYSLR